MRFSLISPLPVSSGDLDVCRACGGPGEADAPLVAKTDAVLVLAVALQLLKAIARWNAKVVEVLVEEVGVRVESNDGRRVPHPQKRQWGSTRRSEKQGAGRMLQQGRLGSRLTQRALADRLEMDEK